jgi:hypothetical protein
MILQDPRQRGESDPRQRGESDPRQRGESDPRQRGESDPRQRGESRPRQRGESRPAPARRIDNGGESSRTVVGRPQDIRPDAPPPSSRQTRRHSSTRVSCMCPSVRTRRDRRMPFRRPNTSARPSRSRPVGLRYTVRVPGDPYRTRAIVQDERDSTPDLGGWASGDQPEVVIVATPRTRRLAGVLLAFGVFAGGFVANTRTVEPGVRAVPSASAGQTCSDADASPAIHEIRLRLRELVRHGRATPSERTTLIQLCHLSCDPACAR